MIWAFDVTDVDPLFARRFSALALQHELLLRPIGSTVYLMPPYVLDEAEIEHLTQQTIAVLEQTLAEQQQPSGNSAFTFA